MSPAMAIGLFSPSVYKIVNRDVVVFCYCVSHQVMLGYPFLEYDRATPRQFTPGEYQHLRCWRISSWVFKLKPPVESGVDRTSTRMPSTTISRRHWDYPIERQGLFSIPRLQNRTLCLMPGSLCLLTLLVHKGGINFLSSCQFWMFCQLSGSMLTRTILFDSTHACTGYTVVMQKRIGSWRPIIWPRCEAALSEALFSCLGWCTPILKYHLHHLDTALHYCVVS